MFFGKPVYYFKRTELSLVKESREGEIVVLPIIWMKHFKNSDLGPSGVQFAGGYGDFPQYTASPPMKPR